MAVQQNIPSCFGETDCAIRAIRAIRAIKNNTPLLAPVNSAVAGTSSDWAVRRSTMPVVMTQ